MRKTLRSLVSERTMTFVSRTALLCTLLTFAAVLANARGGGNLLFAQVNPDCNEYNRGEVCGSKKTCLRWKTTEINIGKEGGGLVATCAEEVTLNLYRYRSHLPPNVCCTWCHCPPGGLNNSGTYYGEDPGGVNGGEPFEEECGDPTMWTDNTMKCEEGMEEMS